MRIIDIIPGSGGKFYCENCVRDLALVNALRELGHDVMIVPMYLPLEADDPDVRGTGPVFYGAVNTFLDQRVPLYRALPRWIRRGLDSPRALKWAADRSGSTRAAGLDAITIAMLKGEEGVQARGLNELIGWLRSQEKPDVVHLSNALLLGLARRIRTELGVPVVCSLQDEDQWVDAMPAASADAVWQILRERAADVAAFVAVSRCYGEAMSRRMALAPDKVHVVPPGLRLDAYNQAPLHFRPPVLGYISRMSDALGLGILVEAFIRLKSTNSWLRHMRLRVMGGWTEDDRAFLEGLRDRLGRLNMLDEVEFILDFDARGRIDVLQTLSVYSVPAPKGEAFGLHVLEAIASGVPVVQPAIGGFQEIVDATGGGVLYDPADMDQYVDLLGSLLLNPDRAREMGRRGRAAVHAAYGIKRSAERLAAVYAGAAAKV